MISDNLNNQAQAFRETMVARQLEPRGIDAPRVLKAFRKVPRHRFVPGVGLKTAYADHPIPIGEGQTISQPYMVALMTQLLDLNADARVLEIGTGSGYQAAILAELSRQVYSVERIPSIADRTGRLLAELGYDNIEIKVADGTRGWKENSPYDGIIVTAGAPEIPQPLVEQLGEGGSMVIPAGRGYSQNLLVLKRRNGKILKRDAGGCVFVPLIGEFGWREEKGR